jgi:hypothetical protein
MSGDDEAKLPESTYCIVPTHPGCVALPLNFQGCIRSLELISNNVKCCLNRRVLPVVSSEIFQLVERVED